MSRERIPRIVETVAAGAALALAALVAYGDAPTGAHWQAAVFFTAFGLLASLLGYKTAGGAAGSIGFLPFLSVALIAPNIAAVLTVGVSILVSELLVRRPAQKVVFNVAHIVFAHATAIFVYLAMGGEPMVGGNSPSIPAFIAMVAVFFAINKLAVSTVIALSTGGETRAIWMRSMRGSAVYDLLAFPLILFFASVYARAGWQMATGFVLPVLMMRQLYKTTSALHKVNEELLQLMVAAIEARDPYTSGHSQRVSMYARVIARVVGLNGRVIERITTAALLHDVGKIHEEFAPILRKPGRLTEDEYEVMKTHSAKSSVLVGKVSQFADLVPMVHAHHEAWDGRGYPNGTSGSDIPLGARIIALADTIDAMTTSRPYRRAMTSDEVRAELTRESGHQFDPVICRKLLNDIAWREITREIAVAASQYPVSREHPEITPEPPRLLQMRQH